MSHSTGALALSRHGAVAGTTAATIGFAQFGAASVVASIVGLSGNMGLAVAIAMTTSATLGFVAVAGVSKRRLPTSASRR